MNKPNIHKTVVMGIYPRTRGFGFVIFRGPAVIYRWGIKEIRANTNSENMLRVAELLSQYRPDVVVLDDCGQEASRRGKRIESLIENIAELCERKRTRTNRYSRSMVRECFSEFHAMTKLEVAQAIAKSLPELRPQLPGKRKIWLPEDPRMAIFDAAALVFAYFYFTAHQKRTA